MDIYLSHRANWHASYSPEPVKPDSELPDVQYKEHGSGQKEACAKDIA
jgi:hypothetical protein